MKKKLLILFSIIALSLPSVSLSQTHLERDEITKDYNLLESSKLALKVQSSTKKSLNRAVRLSKRYNWPLTIDYKDGGFGQLVSVLDDKYPLYYRTYNKEGISTIHADAVHSGGDAGLDLNGQGMIVGVWDAKAVHRLHELFGSVNSRVSVKDSVNDLNDHATHVTGTIIGSAVVNNGNTIGVAPQAKAHTYDWENDYMEMIREAEGGLLASNHSYGIGTIDDDDEPILPVSYFGQYDKYAQTLDEILYNFEYYLPAYAVGNDGGVYTIINPSKNGYDLLTAETNSKNNLVVGSIRKIEDASKPTSIPISNFSNFGPTDDGRIKPDITAKGESITSAISTSDTAYAIMSGTSMATPFVTGSVLLIQEHAKNIFNHYLKSATVRGLVAHTATKAGAEGSPNYRFGWGVMNVEKAVEVISKHRKSTLLREMVLEQNQEYLLTVNASELEQIIATIAWTDYPGEQKTATDDRTPILVNDLDIRISRIGGDLYYPYVLNPIKPSATATTGDNYRDNIEKIEVFDAEGEYNVTISHKGNLREDRQRFSMLLSGIKETPLLFETYDNNISLCSSAANEVSMKLLISSEKDISNTVVTIENIPQQISASIDASDLANGVVWLNIDGIGELEDDIYTIELKAKNGSDETNLYPSFSIRKDVFAPVNLLSPDNKIDDIKNHIRFKWEPSYNDRVKSYTLEIAHDEAFVDVIEIIKGLIKPERLFLNLKEERDYYWRVKAIGECGEGEYSEVFVFHTYNLLSVDDFEQNSYVVYPNPAANQVSINAPTLIKEVKVMNILGQEIMVLNPDSSQVQIDISTFASGNYLLSISDENTTQVKRLIKK